MDEIIKLFEKIKNTSGLNAKKTILLNNKDNELFKYMLKYLLDGNAITGLSDKKIEKNLSTNFINPPEYKEFKDLIEYLLVNNTGKDADIAVVKAFLKNQPEECRDWYKQMITKKYKLGCDAKVVNSVISGLIPTFNVCLGTPIDKCNLKGNEWISISHKLNGSRCAFVGDRLMTRQGKEYTGCQHIINDLVKMGYEKTFVDGELLYKNEDGLLNDSEAFQKGVGIAMSNDPEKPQLKLVVFDMFPLDEFWTGKSKLKYRERKKSLYDLQERIKKYDVKNIGVVDLCYEGTDHSQIWKWLDKAEAMGWEGVCCNLDAQYECKRTKNLLKVKKFFSADVLCTGIERGSGKNINTLGALICDYKGYQLKVGSGFSDADRSKIWTNPSEVIGKIISVKYKEETKNKDGGLSVQFPVFECVRFDKTEPSYN